MSDRKKPGPKPRTPILRFLNLTNIDRPKACWEWKGSRTHNGYGRFSIGRSKTVRAHRHSYKFFRGEIPEGMLVIHTCDNPSCVNPRHLKLGTQKDNMRQMYESGRWSKQKLIPPEASEIRKIYASGDYLQREIAEKYNVTQHHVSAIINGRFWDGY